MATQPHKNDPKVIENKNRLTNLRNVNNNANNKKINGLEDKANTNNAAIQNDISYK